MDHQPISADLEMIEVLLQHIQQNPSEIPYPDIGDDDEDAYDSEEEDDDGDFGYGEHSIHTILNPYNQGGDMGGAENQMGFPMQTVNLLQGLLNMNGGNPMDAMSAGMGGMGGMSGPMDGGSGGFLPNMQSFMNSDMAGALAGAFAGGMNSLMEGYAGGGPIIQECDDDDLTDDDEDNEDLDDEEEETDEDDDDPSMLSGGSMMPAVGAVGAAGLMASMLAQNGHHGGPMSMGPRSPPMNSPLSHSLGQSLSPPMHPQHKPSLMPMPMPLPIPLGLPDMQSQLSHQIHQNQIQPNQISQNQIAPPVSTSAMPSSVNRSVPIPKEPQTLSRALSIPSVASQANRMMAAVSTTSTVVSNTMSGGTVSRVDLFAALALGGAASTSGIIASPLTSSGGKTLVNNKLDTSDASNTTIIGCDSLNTSAKTVIGEVDELAALMSRSHIVPPNSTHTQLSLQQGPHLQSQIIDKKTNVPAISPPKPTRVLKDDSDDEKASVPGSETSGGGKSDTESVRKKTPSPILVTKMGRVSPTSSESTHGQELASCASITDLASATESMRDSDTDNHSDAHNVTANFSDLDNDLIDCQKLNNAVRQQYSIPFINEVPTTGWEGMVGLQTPKEQLKKLFYMGAFPEVFENTKGTVRGVLLFGPSGSGKTTLSRGLAKECDNSALVGIACGFLLNMAPLDAMAFIKYAFETARMKKPSVLLFDDIDALNYSTRMDDTRISILKELLAQVRGYTVVPQQQYAYSSNEAALMANDGVLLVGTTNQPWHLDDEIRRLFTYNIHVKLPSEKDREELFRTFTQQLPCNLQDAHYKCLVSKSDGYSAADINIVVRQATCNFSNDRSHYGPNGMTRPNMIMFDDFATAMTTYRCRHNEDLKKKYNRYIEEATHRTEELRKGSKDRTEKPKSVKRFGQRILKKFVAAAVTVID